jgi:hypothetical protein
MSKFCSSVIRYNNDFTPSEEEVEPLRRMSSLLTVLRETTESAKNKACVLELSKMDNIRKAGWEECKTQKGDIIRLPVKSGDEDYEEFKIGIWEPKFDKEASRTHKVPKDCVLRMIVSDEDYHQFWVANGDEAQQVSA